MKGLPHDDLTRVVVRLWAIWQAHCKAIHENIFRSPLSTYSFRKRFVAEVDWIKPKPMEHPQHGGQGMIPQWIVAPADFLKINVDVAISKNSRIAAPVVVARDDNGAFLGASALGMAGVTNAEIAEAPACRE